MKTTVSIFIILLIFIGCGSEYIDKNRNGIVDYNSSPIARILNKVEPSLEDKITGLYVAYFRRAPDWDGLQYWNSRGDNKLKELSFGFAQHKVFTSTYSQFGNQAFVEAIYQNILGQSGDSEGIKYWNKLIDNGLSRSDMVADFVDISLSVDLTSKNFPTLSTLELAIAQDRQDLLSNKVAVALHFTNTFKEKSNIENLEYPERDSAYKASMKILEDITQDIATVTEKISYINALATKNNPMDMINGIKSVQVTYSTDKNGVQQALDDSNYNYVINQLLYNRSTYSDMSDDEVNMNIAGAYVGISGYTVFDMTGAIAVGNDNNNSLNGFIHDITKNNNALDTLENLEKADTYYSEIVRDLNCSDTTNLSDEQKASCFNLGLIRLTSLSNSVKLLFGGDEEIVKEWANGVDINSSDDLNGNSVIDGSDASACAIVYANNPNDSCGRGSMFTYRGKISFSKSGVEYNATLIEVDVGSATHGFNNFYKITTNRADNNSVILTNGVCDRNLNITTESIDGTDYFPCPTFNSDGTLMTIADSLALSANLQGLFPNGSDTRNTANAYIKNITGSVDGVIDQNNLSDYLQRN